MGEVVVDHNLVGPETFGEFHCNGCNWVSGVRLYRSQAQPSFDAFHAPKRLLEEIVPTEVRTTSSTGGQKGVKLQRFDLIPIFPLTKLAEHYGAGARKYDSHQWRKGYEFSKGYSALLRHLTAWWNGEDYDTCPKEDDGSCSNVDIDGNVWAFGGLTSRGAICYNHTGNHHLDGVMWHSFALREFVEKYPQHDDRFKDG